MFNDEMYTQCTWYNPLSTQINYFSVYTLMVYKWYICIRLNIPLTCTHLIYHHHWSISAK